MEGMIKYILLNTVPGAVLTINTFDDFKEQEEKRCRISVPVRSATLVSWKPQY